MPAADGRAPDPKELRAFMLAIRAMESGGKVLGAANYRIAGKMTKYGRAKGAYQFIDSTWNNYGGFGRASDAPAAVQDAKAAQLMTQYFKEFRTWELVAIAWHAGPGKARQVVRQGRKALAGVSDGITDTEKYAQWVDDNMNIVLGRLDPRSNLDPTTGRPYSRNRGVDAFFDAFNPNRSADPIVWGQSEGLIDAALGAAEGAGYGSAIGSQAATATGIGGTVAQAGFAGAGSGVAREPEDALGYASGGPGTTGTGPLPAGVAPIINLENGGELDLSDPEAVKAEVEARYGDVSDEDFIEALYRDVFSREPDPEGLAFWQGQLDSGMSRDEIYRSFYASPEGGETEPPLLTEVEQAIRSRYPDWAWAMNNDEIREILLEAIDPERGMDAVTFRSRINQTDWWQNTEASVRQWDAESAIDPATARRKIERTALNLGRQATALGVQMDQEELEALAEKVLRFGLSDVEVADALAAKFDAADPRGDVAENLRVARAKARDYMVNISDNELIQWAQGVASGQASADDLDQRILELSKAKFGTNPQLVGMIEAGISPRVYFADHQSLIAQEMDLGLNQVDLADPRYASVLSSGASGTLRPMDLNETRAWVRSQDDWQYTSTGRRRIAETAERMLRAFGKVA